MKKILKEWRQFLEESAGDIEAILADIEQGEHRNAVQALTTSPAFKEWSLKTFAEVVKNPRLEIIEALTNQFTRSRTNPRTGKRIDFEAKNELQTYKELIEQEIFELYEAEGRGASMLRWPPFWDKWISETQDFMSPESVFFRYLRDDVKHKFKDELFNEKFPAFYDELFKRSEAWRELILRDHGDIVQFKLHRAGTATNIMIGRLFGDILLNDFKEATRDLYLGVIWVLDNYDGEDAAKVGRMLISEDPSTAAQGLEIANILREAY